MDLSFYPLTLEAIDQAAVESLCLFIGADERPLTGLAGLADWRLSGRLSRLLRSGLLTGEAGEAVLTPPGSRMSFRKLFLFGVGKAGQSDEQLAERVAQALRKLAQAGVQEAALQLPARLSIEAGIRTLIDELQGPGRAKVFGPDPQKMVTALSQAAARGQVRLERPVVKVPTPASVKPILPAVVQPIAVAQPIPVAPAVPKASPLPFAPEADRPQFTPAPPPAVPKATPLPSGPAPQAPAIETSPAAQPLPAGPSAPPPAAGTTAAQPPPPVKPAPPVEATQPPAVAPAAPEERRPAPPPPQRYVPPPPKPHVFETGKGRKKK
jgi:hypothetical protein